VIIESTHNTVQSNSLSNKQKKSRAKMGKKLGPDPPNLRKYGVPLYSVAWVPQTVLKSIQNVTADDSSDADHKSLPETAPLDDGKYLVFAGGGGPGSSGIPNSLLLAHFDVASDSLSDPPVCVIIRCFVRLLNFD
jgi:prolactin regulatory element-binding protein